MAHASVLACTAMAWKDIVTAPFCLAAACGQGQGCSSLAMLTGHSAALGAAAWPACRCWRAKLVGECPQTKPGSLMQPWSAKDCHPHATHMQTCFWAYVKRAYRLESLPASTCTVDCRLTTDNYLIPVSPLVSCPFFSQ